MLQNYIESGGKKEHTHIPIYRRIINYFVVVFIKLLLSIKTIYFLNKQKKHILKNQFIAIYAGRTFGHDLQFFDIVSRYYYPRKVTFIYIPNEKYNPYLLECFNRNLDFIIYDLKGKLHYWVANFLKILIFYYEVRSASWPKHFIIDPRHIVQTLSLSEGEYSFKPFKKDEESLTSLKYVPLSQYQHLIYNHIGKKPGFSDELQKHCEEKIAKKYPSFFDKPFVSLVIRRKGYAGDGANGKFRMGGPHENYIDAVKYLTANGYNVVGTGDTLHKPFSNIVGYFNFEETDLDKDCANIFCLLNCHFLIGQFSGPFPLVNSAGGHVLITDGMALANAPLGPKDLTLYKNVYIDKKYTNIAQICKTNPALLFPNILKHKNIEIKFNTPEQILKAVKEMVARLNGEEDDKRTIGLAQKLRDLAPKTTLLAHYDARPPKFILEEMAEDLL